ncbi:MAG TPA: hypothetical protein VGU20_08295 [Stellaceae bacterium]|nr:hypothetical protein [Stellaceae bacterium]
MSFLNMLAIAVCAWLLFLAVTGAIEHMRLRRDENRAGVPLKS